MTGRVPLLGFSAVAAIAGVALHAAPLHAACSTAICAGDPCTINGTHVLDNSCHLDFGTKRVTVGKNAVLRTAPGQFFRLSARRLVIEGELRALGGSIDLVVQEDLDMPLAGSLIDVSTTDDDLTGAVGIAAGGVANLGRILANAPQVAGDILIDGGALMVRGPLQANGLGQGIIWLDATGDVEVTGTVTASSTGAKGEGGTIDSRVGGTTTVRATGRLLTEGSGADASGGLVFLVADTGAVIDGILSADASGNNGVGGEVDLDSGGSITVTGDLSANGGGGPFAAGGGVVVGATGDVVLSNKVGMTANAGNGGVGGEVWVEANGAVDVAGDLEATGGGVDSWGGRVWVMAGAAETLSLAGSIDVRSKTANGSGDGAAFLSACTVTVSGTARADQHPNGQVQVRYSGTFGLTSSGRLLAGSVGGNEVTCACKAPTPGASCTAPLACAAIPVQPAGAIVKPAFRLRPQSLPPCSCFDGAKNGSETGTDCGGSVCVRCPVGQGCVNGTDCQTLVCTAGTCAAPSCTDAVSNGNESGVDCGGADCPKCAVGAPCDFDDDCVTDVCQAGVCRPAGCGDGIRNGQETDVDCGGTVCAPCQFGKTCGKAKDCVSGVCKNGKCAGAGCPDGVKNGPETDIDCGGGSCATCQPGQECTQASDCASGVCSPNGRCAAPVCPDGVRNGTETDVDCGGANTCPRCLSQQLCAAGSDCAEKVCGADGTCQDPTCTDQASNGSETGTDCGGGTCPACPPGQPCEVASDCDSKVCPASLLCAPPRCDDGVKNGPETGIDCGGGTCPGCPPGQPCGGDGDCKEHVCSGGVCQPPRCDDGRRNGAETDVDCGGGCPTCADGRTCLEWADCTSGFCLKNVRVCLFGFPCPGHCAQPQCHDRVRNGAETGEDCGGPMCPKCPAGQPCTDGGDCQSGVCRNGFCQQPTCNDGVKNGSELDVDCGPPCGPCGFGAPCGDQSQCQSGACTNGHCGCPEHEFLFVVDTNHGGAADPAEWPSGTDVQSVGGGCGVTVQLPDDNLDEVCTLGKRFAVLDYTRFSSCAGTGGEDGDGCQPIDCPFAGVGSCCFGRPSCSVAINGEARAAYRVKCEP